ncbi:MAG: GNAT family N-acetyltransferase [Gorillibacterium sp.]|nr:GNAT family N-acetyltransferase [Gorillibacterium sp.]
MMSDLIREIDVMDNNEALQVLSLQLASYRIEADVIGFNDLPPLKDTFSSLRKSGQTFCGFFVEGVLAGCSAYSRENNIVHVCRMMVHPDFFRQGIADSLLTYIEEQESDGHQFMVTAVINNLPAVRLYEKHGYKQGDKWEIIPGMIMAKYVRTVFPKGG